MGCRAFLSPWKDKNGKEKYSGRFNIGATTINLPRIAIKNRGNEEGFYKELDRILEICKDNCLFRARYLEILLQKWHLFFGCQEHLLKKIKRIQLKI